MGANELVHMNIKKWLMNSKFFEFVILEKLFKSFGKSFRKLFTSWPQLKILIQKREIFKKKLMNGTQK